MIRVSHHGRLLSVSKCDENPVVRSNNWPENHNNWKDIENF